MDTAYRRTGHIKLYIEAEQKRMAQGFNYVIDIAKNIDKDNALVPPLVIQPFVKHSIWDGLAGMPVGEGVLNIRIVQEDQHLLVNISDNGTSGKKIEIPLNNTEKSGIDLAILRLNTINKKMGVTAPWGAQVFVNEPDEGLRICLPLQPS